VAAELGDTVRIVKVDTETETELASQLQVRYLSALRGRAHDSARAW